MACKTLAVFAALAALAATPAFADEVKQNPKCLKTNLSLEIRTTASIQFLTTAISEATPFTYTAEEWIQKNEWYDATPDSIIPAGTKVCT